jgi:hypothetical protein
MAGVSVHELHSVHVDRFRFEVINEIKIRELRFVEREQPCVEANSASKPLQFNLDLVAAWESVLAMVIPVPLPYRLDVLKRPR